MGLSLDWQVGQVANSAVVSERFKGILTLGPNCSVEAVTRTLVSKVQKGIKPHRAQHWSTL